MKRILLSALIAVGIHGFLLSADFSLPWSSAELPEIPERLTVVMVPAPLPAKKPISVPPPPPAHELLVKTNLAKIPVDLPKEIPLTAKAPSPIGLKPKESLKAWTFKSRVQLPEPEPAQQPVVQPQLQASKQAPVAEPVAETPVAPSASVEKTPKKLTSVAAVHRPTKFIPDRLAIPLLKQNPPPVYPKSARRRGYQGAVILKVLVAVNGSVETVELDRSCGYEILDRTAISAVREWQFKPGIKGGKKTKMWVKVPVRFELK